MEWIKEGLYIWRNDQKRREAVVKLSDEQLHRELKYSPSMENSRAGRSFMRAFDLVGAMAWGMGTGGWIRTGEPLVAVAIGGVGLGITLIGINGYRTERRLHKLHLEIVRELQKRSS